MFFVSTSNITKLFDKNNSYSFEYQKNSYFILGCAAVVQEGNIRKTMAARGLVNGRGPRSGRDLVFRCYPPDLLLTPQKKKLTFWVSLLVRAKGIEPIRLSAPDPKSGLSTNFNTPATIGLQIYDYFSFLQNLMQHQLSIES